MVRSYVKYERSHIFGVVDSAIANVVWAVGSARGTGIGNALVGANEQVLCWDLKKGDLVSHWRDHNCNSQVSALARSRADTDVYAVGYEDGSIRLWDSRISEVLICFNGHRTAITTLAFDQSGTRLASGSRDTDIIIWDLVEEMGLFKLRGHKECITSVQFIEQGDLVKSGTTDLQPTRLFLLSAGRDSLIKLWDVTSQYCIETHVAQTNGQCWTMGFLPDGSGCITAGSDGELKVWSIDAESLWESAKCVDELAEKQYLHDKGTFYRHGKDRTLGINFHPHMDYVAFHGSERAIEIWRTRTEGEIHKALARKRKRRRGKVLNKAENDDMEMDQREEMHDMSAASVDEIFVQHAIVRTGGKVHSMDWISTKSTKTLQLLVSTTNNILEVYTVQAKDAKTPKPNAMSEYARACSIDLPGHRTDIRTIALSSDDKMLASASSGSLKIWNVNTKSCLRTFECGYPLSCLFLPGDKIVLIATKDGELELFDIASSTLVDHVRAHDGAVWTLAVHPNGRSLVTGGADKMVKFWNFEVTQEEIPGTKRTTSRLRLSHASTLKANDDILSVCFSPDSRLLAVATLDNTVKIFFVDTLKLFLSLYGHKLPVLNMSISSDSKLIATCSADKNIRIWGLEFGDCHKTFFAHRDSIMQVAFIPHPISKEECHIFFSSSKDKTIKTWDGDKFEQIQKLEGHHGEIWAMAVSRTGEFIVTASHDKSIRIWSQSDEAIFLEEEREQELEELYESTLVTSLKAEQEFDHERTKDEVVLVTKQTITTLTAGEKIMEALEIGTEDLNLIRAWQVRKSANPNVACPQRDPRFLFPPMCAERYVLNAVSKIPAAQLHDALLLLPFSILPSLFTFIRIWIQRRWDITLVCRVLFFMLKHHQRQIVASKELKIMLEGMREDLRKTLDGTKDMFGFNLAALKFVFNKVDSEKVVKMEDLEGEDDLQGEKKRAFVAIS